MKKPTGRPPKAPPGPMPPKAPEAVAAPPPPEVVPAPAAPAPNPLSAVGDMIDGLLRPGAAPASPPAPSLGAKRLELVSGAPGAPGEPPARWKDHYTKAADLIPPEELVQKYQILGDTMAMMSAAVSGLAFDGEDAKLKLAELERISKAWALLFALQPPKDILTFAKLNLLVVHVQIFGPRLARKFGARIRAWWKSRREAADHKRKVQNDDKEGSDQRRVDLPPGGART